MSITWSEALRANPNSPTANSEFIFDFFTPSFTAKQIPNGTVNNGIFNDYSVIPEDGKVITWWQPGDENENCPGICNDNPIPNPFDPPGIWADNWCPNNPKKTEECQQMYGPTSPNGLNTSALAQCQSTFYTYKRAPDPGIYYMEQSHRDGGQSICLCGVSVEVSCGIFDPIKSCTLGKNGTGVCRGKSIQNTDWGVINPQQSDKQLWIYCTYAFPFDPTFIATPYSGNDLLAFVGWLTDVYNNITSEQTRIRDTNVIHGLVYDIFNQMYSTGIYANANIPNGFQAVDIMNSTYFQEYFSTYKNMYYTSGISPITKLYEGKVSPAIDTIINNACSLPTVEYNPASYAYILTMYVNSDQYQNIQENGENVITQFLSSLFRDNQSQIMNGNSPIPQPEMKISLINMQQVVLDTQTLFVSTQYSTWTPTSTTFFVNGIANVQILGWTPCLYMYFAKNGIDMRNMCDTFTQNIGMIPLVCMGGCDDSKCSQVLSANCQIYYQPPSYTQENLFLTGNNNYCMCYNSGVQPAQLFSQGNVDAMCFDKNCPADMINTFGLNNQTCAGACSTVQGWITNNDPSLQPADYSAFNSQKYENLCGPINSASIEKRSINISVLLTGLLCTFLFCVLAFSIGKHAELSGINLSIVVVWVFLVFIGISVFLGYDLNGEPILYKNGDEIKFKCESKITKTKIPSQFCKFQYDTQCIQDSDCGLNCFCSGGTCISKVGTQSYTDKSVANPNIPMIVTCCVIFIILPIILIYLYRDYHWPINIYVYSAGIIIISVISLVFLSIFAFSKTTKREYHNICTEGSVRSTSEGSRLQHSN